MKGSISFIETEAELGLLEIEPVFPALLVNFSTSSCSTGGYRMPCFALLASSIIGQKIPITSGPNVEPSAQLIENSKYY